MLPIKHRKFLRFGNAALCATGIVLAGDHLFNERYNAAAGGVIVGIFTGAAAAGHHLEIKKHEAKRDHRFE